MITFRPVTDEDFALLAAWQLARWLYAVPILVFTGVRPRQALAESARMTRGQLARIVVPLVLWWLLVTLWLVVSWPIKSLAIRR